MIGEGISGETISQPIHLSVTLSKLMELGQHNPLLFDNQGSFLKVELHWATSVFVCGETITLGTRVWGR